MMSIELFIDYRWMDIVDQTQYDDSVPKIDVSIECDDINCVLLSFFYHRHLLPNDADFHRCLTVDTKPIPLKTKV